MKTIIRFTCFMVFLPAALSSHAQVRTATAAFYKATGNNLVWVNAAGRKNLLLLAGYIAQAPYLGLQPQSYRPQLLSGLLDGMPVIPPTGADSVLTDQQVTAIAIQFFSDVAYGWFKGPPVKFNGPAYDPRKESDISAMLAASLLTNTFDTFLRETEPDDPAYHLIKDKIAFLYNQVTDTAFKEIPVRAANVDSSNRPLLLRLKQLGIPDTMQVTGKLTVPQVRLRYAQRMFNLLDDGSLRSSVLKALNVPIAARLQALDQALNVQRWLSAAKKQAAVIVNIPSGDLVMYRQDTPLVHSRVITGKKSTPTPTLCSHITEVILFPYWMVPYKIATKELLPHIQQDIGYLEANGFEVLDKSGRAVDPFNVKWHTLSPGYFPYVIRQNTGCDNSLGIIKLNFYSPFSVYLHDTPWKSLFMLNQRFFSHGCVRVEEAAVLARILLKEQAVVIDTLITRAASPTGKPITFPLTEPAWVFILYNTAWLNEEEQLRFYDDVYGIAP
ncbi:Murein L,D-transpeptidase YcbB/YkuD [Chitinophaga rupis]|uniref:Murein L,D-transpeptidase YcbB/YkuD n=1 Tax=Chitinophaga rupis TaxID=573321 RepID=A0A1H7PX63_9BACT|nr:L,D-transpeptidase family protein [Chitinophaga rupis]SEL40323.1 Murein L,D-transpeptidase YcbB/YkuD [Chitinophaga rupis]